VTNDTSTAKDATKATSSKVVRHIEHYANGGDFVAQFGVLNYCRVANRFMGRVFLSPNRGHLLNQHYLHYMFPLDEDRQRTADNNEFMDMDVRLNRHDVANREQIALGDGDEDNIAFVGDVNSAVAPMVLFSGNGSQGRRLKVKDFSRLWQYRNGGFPSDDEIEV